MERYWVPSDPESALFGTRMTDRWFEVATGGDLAVPRRRAEGASTSSGWVDERLRRRRTRRLRRRARRRARGELGGARERQRAAARRDGGVRARAARGAKSAVLVWSMGATQHVFGEDNVRAIVNLALSQGFVGREKCGLMPIRGHSGVQGGAEMGCYATALPGHRPTSPESAAELSAQWGFEVPGAPRPDGRRDARRRARRRARRADQRGRQLPRGDARPGLGAGGAGDACRCASTWTSSSRRRCSSTRRQDVLLLPMTTRYESPGGVTETTTERRVIFSPEIEGHRIGEARPEWRVFGELAAARGPSSRTGSASPMPQSIREEIAPSSPATSSIAGLRERGDQFQIGGAAPLRGPSFPLPGGRARFQTVSLPEPEPDDGRLRLSTRRGKQFNSMVQSSRDALTGAARVGRADQRRRRARGSASRDGAAVIVRSDHGELPGRARIGPIRAGDVQVHWPEGNVLIGREARSPEARVPDYNARVSVEPT